MYDKVPQELKEIPQWVNWQYREVGDRKTKIPINPHTGANASSTDPAQWGTFEQALSRVEWGEVDGIGIVFANGVMGIDIDHCIDPDTDKIDATALEIIGAVHSYTELSPSGTGIHILCRGNLPQGRRRRGNVEMYATGRFFTVTGQVFGEAYPFGDRTAQVGAMHAKYLGEQQPAPLPASALAARFAGGNSYDTDTLLEKSFDSANGQQIRDLYEGRWEGYHIGDGSQSSADQAFCNHMAFWLGCDAAQIDAVFRRSGLMRPKWDKRRGAQTYGQKTIARAIADCTRIYEPERARRPTRALPPPPPPNNSVPSSPATEEEDGTSPKQKPHYPFDDTGNANRFRDLYYKELRYNPVDKLWLYWDGRRWAIDETGEIKRRADQMLTAMGRELHAMTDDPEAPAAAFRKHLTRSRSSRGKNAFIEEAKHLSGIPVLPSALDRPGNVLNVSNCIVSLKTGNAREHDRSILLSKLADVAYDPAAVCPRWMAFLHDITAGDQQLMLFLQRMAGYCLTASTREQCVFFLYGNGSNGKSTFVETLTGIMGEYATSCQPETVMVRDKSNTARADIARLRGCRLVATYEPNEGNRIDEGIVKQLTGGDKVVARFLYGREFEFVPEFKIMLATNHKPVIKGTDTGIWRRIRMVPFTVEIPDAKKDKALPQKLRKEQSGILRWAVAGAIGWYREGLPKVEAVEAATSEYREEMDRLAQFVEECLHSSAGATLQASLIYRCYKAWCEEVGERYPVNGSKLASELKKRFNMRKTSAYNEYLDVAFTSRGDRLSTR